MRGAREQRSGGAEERGIWGKLCFYNYEMLPSTEAKRGSRSVKSDETPIDSHTLIAGY